MYKNIKIKIVVSVSTLMLIVVLVAPDNALAGTQINVTVYVAGGVVIGGVAVFFSVFLGSDRHHSKHEKKNDGDENHLSEKYALNAKSVQLTQEEISRSGLVKIYEW